MSFWIRYSRAIPGTCDRANKSNKDEARLPEGMERVGYDADRQVYIFTDEDGSYWESEEGNRYGQLHRQGQSPPPTAPISARARDNDFRYFAPWVLIVVVVLLSLFWFINRPSATLQCPRGTERYQVAKGDTCWAIATDRGIEVDALTKANARLDCDRLQPGDQLCLPLPSIEG